MADRGLKEAMGALQHFEPTVEEASPELVREGNELLTAVAQGFGNRELNGAQMEQVLTAMILGTSFASAKIENFGQQHVKPTDIYQNMYVQMGEYTSGHAYNVWFSRDKSNGAWSLRYNQIPRGGNLRSSLK